MTTIINLLGLCTLIRIGFKVLRLFKGSKRGKGNKSIIGKILTFMSRGINYRLDAALKNQGEAHGYAGKVIPMRYKKKAHGGA